MQERTRVRALSSKPWASTSRRKAAVPCTVRSRSPSVVHPACASFRWIQDDPIANAWYQRKKQRDGGRASRAAVALMRKLAKGLYHVGRGGTFDSSKLFDTRRLQVAV